MQSFYEWCIENNHNELIEAWDKSKNPDINSISKSIHKKYWFKINNLCSYNYFIDYITDKSKALSPFDKYLNSFGYLLLERFGNDAIEKYWSSKNEISPFDVWKSSKKKV